MSYAFREFQNPAAISKVIRSSTVQEHLIAAGVRGTNNLDFVRLVNTRRGNSSGHRINGALTLTIFVSVAMALGSSFIAAALGAELVEILACYVCAGNVGLLGTALILDRYQSDL